MSIFSYFSKKLQSQIDAAKPSDLPPAGPPIPKPKSSHPLDRLPYERNLLVAEIASLRAQIQQKEKQLGEIEILLSHLAANNNFWNEVMPGGME